MFQDATASLNNINRYLLNLKREIGLQVRLMNPKTLGEAQNFGSETEMWMKESHQSTKQQIVTPRPPIGIINRLTPPPRTLANSTPPKAHNRSMPLVDRSQIKCHKCRKLGHFATQCFTNTQNFRKGTTQKQPPEIRTTRESEAMEDYLDKQEMTQEEITEKKTARRQQNLFIIQKIAVSTRKKTRWIYIPTISRQRSSHKHYKKNIS